MASSYSTNLALELIGTGDQAGTWGVTTNTNLGTLIEQAISGYVTQAVSTGGDTTITIPNGATGVARNMYIELTGTGGASTNLIVPSNKKLYFIFNNTASGQVTVKVSGQTGVSVPNGAKMILVSNGTDIVDATNFVGALSATSLTVSSGSTLNGGVVVNETGADVDFRVEGDTDANLLFADASTDRIGVGTNAPADKLSVLTAQGIDTFANPIMSYGANTNWPAGFANIYDASYVDQFMLLNARMTGGTRAAPTFTASSPEAGGISFKVSGSNPGGLEIQTIPNGSAQSATTRLTLTTSGNLGLGVTPSAWGSGLKAFQFSNGSVTGFLSAISTNEINIGSNAYNDGTNWKYYATAPASLFNQSDGNFQFFTAASGTAGNNITFTQAMTLTSGGDLVVGATSAFSSAAGRGNISVNGASTAIVAVGAGGNRKGYLYTDGTNCELGADSILTFSTASGSERARITADGYLLVETTSTSATSGVGSKFVPEGRLYQVSSYDANTQESLSMYSTGASAYRFYVGWGGTVYATNTSISAISDQRLKENIRDLDAGLDAVMALKPRKFDWKEGKGANTKDARGFIAQEFEQVFPDLVDEWRDPAPEGEEPYKSVRQDLIPVLVKAIQELSAKNDALEARIAALEAK